MNWTGGNLQRHSKNKGNAVVERQKSHFAKARSKVPNRNSSSVKSWNETSPHRPPSPPPFKKTKTHHKRKTRIHEWSITGKRDAQRPIGDFVLPSKNSDVYVRVGKRAFASQLDTTAASPSTRIRSRSGSYSEHSPNSMLLDTLDQPVSTSRGSDRGESPRLQFDEDEPTHPATDQMRFVLSDSLDDVLRDQKGVHHRSGPVSHVPSDLHENAVSPANSESARLADYARGTLDAAERVEDSPVEVQAQHTFIFGIHAEEDPTSFDHEDFGDNDDTWRRFIEDKDEEYGQAESDLFAAPQYNRQASPDAHPAGKKVQEEPLYPTSVRGSTPQSSCPTARACLLETGTSKRMGGEISERGPRLSDDDQIWRRFILGADYADAL
ncbi:hypothetical protein D6C92_07886 [Aureobasidium pullulans]|nr:hypothetical protein D6C92_07886 [Aureobasidium pullulans]THY91130.1 hypothetical protein D6C93_06365 [Aureobasidium pullulans]THZ13721.1 hypothetical protein D6C89_10411 [Aureobasidium pullulans]